MWFSLILFFPDMRLIVIGAIRSRVTLLLQGTEGAIAGGDVIISDLGRIQILPWEQSLGANVTNFAVSCVTTPVVLACLGWDDATVTRLPMGKLVGDNSVVIFDAVGA